MNRAPGCLAIVLNFVGVCGAVSGFPSERLDGSNSSHALDKLNDEPRGIDARRSEFTAGRVRKPPGDGDDGNQRDSKRNSALWVDRDQSDGGERKEQQTRHEVAQSPTQQFAESVDVTRLTGDDAARRVPLMEFEAESLGVLKDSTAKCAENVLAHRDRQARVGREQSRCADSGRKERANDCQNRR
ncbi:unannotated protein [freshwater metagenome]|uniref:Unannotated protein n=1 Tax=freshwater metagenome TaxID=449393 RepID=A0A6J6BSD5_9ZZZZ